MLGTVEQTLIDIRDQLTVRPIFVASNCWRPIVVRPIVVLPFSTTLTHRLHTIVD
jgi:hypothetical protein